MKIEETVQLAAETAGVGAWHLTFQENHLRSSPRCKEVFGLAPEAPFRYEDFLSAVHQEDRALVEATIAHALDPQGTGLYELDYRVLILTEPFAGLGVEEKHSLKREMVNRSLLASSAPCLIEPSVGRSRLP